jgi:hypothetical protein
LQRYEGHRLKTIERGEQYKAKEGKKLDCKIALGEIQTQKCIHQTLHTKV